MTKNQIITRKAEYADLTGDIATWTSIDEDDSRVLMGLPPKSRTYIDISEADAPSEDREASPMVALVEPDLQPPCYSPRVTRQRTPSSDVRPRPISPRSAYSNGIWYAISPMQFGNARWLAPDDGAPTSHPQDTPTVSPPSLHPSLSNTVAQQRVRSYSPLLTHQSTPRTIEWSPINRPYLHTSEPADTSTWPVATTVDCVAALLGSGTSPSYTLHGSSGESDPQARQPPPPSLNELNVECFSEVADSQTVDLNCSTRHTR